MHMGISSTFCPVEECCIQHGFVLRALDIYSDIAFLDYIADEGGLFHRHDSQDRLFFYRQESRRLFGLFSKMYSKTLALSREQCVWEGGGSGGREW